MVLNRPSCAYQNETIYVKMDFPQANEFTQYAFYLYNSENKIVKKIMYSSNPCCYFDTKNIEKNSLCTVKAFVMYKNAENENYQKIASTSVIWTRSAELEQQLRLFIDDTENFKADIRSDIQKMLRTEREVLWANVFHDTIIGSTWLKNKSFSPGHWAVGYPYLYLLYRCLNEIGPKSILELGMGQTTRMIGQYAAHCEGVEHIVTEHDENWVQFFKKSFNFSENTAIHMFELEKTPYKEDQNVLSYSGFEKAFENRKFDLISIDAPFGGPNGGEKYARVDVCRLMPGILNESFVILLDDAHRAEERATANEITNILSESGIGFKSKFYTGEKEVFIAVSEDLSFLASM